MYTGKTELVEMEMFFDIETVLTLNRKKWNYLTVQKKKTISGLF